MAELNESLVKITKGAGIAFLGSLAGLFFSFIGRLLVARYGTIDEYGVFSLALMILSIGAVIASLGLQQGVSRSIAYARGKNEGQKVQAFVSASLWSGLIASLILCLVLVLTSDIIAGGIFHEPTLSFYLKIFAIGIPFFVLINVLVSIFIGFDRVTAKVCFQDILRNALFPLLLLGVIFFALPFYWVSYAYLASLGICCTSLIIYATKRLPSPIRFTLRDKDDSVARELLFFSLPLFGVAMLLMILSWTDTFMLGYFLSSVKVGLYNAALPLAAFIAFPKAAALLIYMPVTSRLYAQGLMPEIRRNFSIVVKWICLATLPLFLILVLFPESVLGFLFGASYATGAIALRILSLAFIIDNVLGASGPTLIAMGKARFIMWATLATVVLNVGLNIALIPLLGIEGAAIALLAAITSVGVIRCWKLYSLSQAQPLSKNLVKPTVVSVALVLVIYSISRNFLADSLWTLLLLFILSYAICGLASLFTKSLDEEDIGMLLAIEKRTGINMGFVKRTLSRFV